MKRIVQTIEVAGEGMDALLGEHVLLFCARYIYAGTLTGVNDTFVLLTDAKIVYETGAFDNPKYTDAQTVGGGSWYVQRAAIESFGHGKA